MSGSAGQVATLGRAEREELLSVARDLAGRCDEAVGRQAAAALAILRARGLAALREALRPNLAVRLGAATRHWERFREICAEDVLRVGKRGPAHAAFLLAWVARLSRASRDQGRRLGPRRR